jgi:signal transduction histidine kinase
MHWLDSIGRWFAGGATPYHDLFHCMRGDRFWIAVTIILDLAVASGYVVIALHWRANQVRLRNQRAKTALGRMKNIFFFCGLCGYIFIPIKMFWPAWRLYDAFMAVLAYVTWRYALDSRNLNVVYNELNRSDQLEADLIATKEESRRKSHFLNAVSHDLRTPLNGLVLQCNYASLSLQNGDMQAARDALAEANEGARATARLLNSFLDLARLDSGEFTNDLTTFRPIDVIQTAIEAVAGEARIKGLQIELKMHETLEICTDRFKFERILLNLLSNAVKFTEQGNVTIGWSQMGNDVRIDVTDTGPGISLDDQARIFEEFFQSRNVARDPKLGVGLGLTIARGLVRQLGGDIRVTSELGHGSRFSVFLAGSAVSGAVEAQHQGSGDINERKYDSASALAG